MHTRILHYIHTHVQVVERRVYAYTLNIITQWNGEQNKFYVTEISDSLRSREQRIYNSHRQIYLTTRSAKKKKLVTLSKHYNVYVTHTSNEMTGVESARGRKIKFISAPIRNKEQNGQEKTKRRWSRSKKKILLLYSLGRWQRFTFPVSLLTPTVHGLE